MTFWSAKTRRHGVTMKINFSSDEGEQEPEESNPLDKIVLVASSKGDQYYEVKVRNNGVAYECTCPGFKFRQHCKHLDMASEI